MSIAKQLPTDVFDYISKNAGIILDTFDTSTWTVANDNIIGATTGGISFTDTPTYVDFGEDIDNCPKNTMELKQIDEREVTVSGNFVSVKPEEIAKLAGTADWSSTDSTITPRDSIKTADFRTLYFVFDYGNGGAVCVELNNALSTGGLSIQTTDKEKSQYAFTYTAHYSSEDVDTVPYKIHIKQATA